MDAKARAASDRLSLLATLAAEPWSFDFFQALRRLELVHPTMPRIGFALHPRDEPIRLGQEPSLSFAPSTLARVEHSKDGATRLLIYFFGVFGPNGPLPLHLTEYARDRERNVHDFTLRRFVDIFHHRMLCFFYRAWASSNPCVSMDRSANDWFADFVGSLCGLGTPALRRRDAIDDYAKRYFAGHLGNQTRHAEGLQSILREYFRLPLRVEQFVGNWLVLRRQDIPRPGHRANRAMLGESAVVGLRVWDRQSKFRIVFGPLSLADYESLLPGGARLRKIIDWVRNYVGDVLLWDVRLILSAGEIPNASLSGSSRLGWTTWLPSQRARRPRDDLILDPAFKGIRAPSSDEDLQTAPRPVAAAEVG